MSDTNKVRIPVTENTLPTFELVCTQDLRAGSLVRIRANCAQMLMIMSIDEVEANGRALPIVHRYSWDDMGPHFRWYIQTLSMAVIQLPEDFPKGAILEVKATLTFHENYGAVNRYSGITWSMSGGVVQDTKAVELDNALKAQAIEFVAGNPDRMEAHVKPNGVLMAQHIDVMGNPADGTGVAFRYSQVDRDTGELEGAFQTGVAAAKILLPSNWKSRGRIRVVDREGREVISNGVPESIDGTPVYFGECHWHTDVSGDGQRSLVDALTSARDELCLDFAGPADHMSPDGSYRKSTTQKQAEICESFNQPGVFCTLPGAELSDRYGHTNIYADTFSTFIEITDRFERELLPRWQAEPNRYVLKELVELCPAGRALVVPHHSNMDSYIYEGVIREDGRPAWNAMHWRIPADRTCIRNFEMVQTRGAFETEETDKSWGVLYGGLGGSARTGLMRGYRYGFVAGTDNHSGWPTRKGNGYCGVTAVQAETLDTESVFQALYRRRCYATTGARIVADVTLNGSPMGSELVLEPGVPRDFQIQVQGTAPITEVQIIHMGYVLADLDVGRDRFDFTGSWSDERPGRPLEDAWYYVRIRQADGNCAWLSPFWVDLPPG